MVTENLNQVRKNIQEACKAVGRDPKEVTLIAVSKTKPVAMIHSVDSLRLAQTIEQEAAKHDVCVPILLEVNVAQEETKFGLKTEEVLPLVESIAEFPHIKIQGLMTIAPYVQNPEENRPIFRQLKKLSVDIAAKNINNVTMSVLSMGMTGDYQIAVQEGATMVRVGTGIFGERDYSKQAQDK